MATHAHSGPMGIGMSKRRWGSLGNYVGFILLVPLLASCAIIPHVGSRFPICISARSSSQQYLYRHDAYSNRYYYLYYNSYYSAYYSRPIYCRRTRYITQHAMYPPSATSYSQSRTTAPHESGSRSTASSKPYHVGARQYRPTNGESPSGLENEIVHNVGRILPDNSSEDSDQRNRGLKPDGAKASDDARMESTAAARAGTSLDEDQAAARKAAGIGGVAGAAEVEDGLGDELLDDLMDAFADLLLVSDP